MEHNDKFSSAYTPGAAVRLFSWSFPFFLVKSHQRCHFSRIPTLPSFASELFMCFLFQLQIQLQLFLKWKHNQNRFYCCSKCIRARGTSGNRSQYRSVFIFTIHNYSQDSGKTTCSPLWTRQNILTWTNTKQPNPLFNPTWHYPCLSHGGEQSLPARERLIIFRINHHAAPPLSDISQCSSNP